MLGQVYPQAAPPGGLPGYPAIQLDLGAAVEIYGTLGAGGLPVPGLPLGGVNFDFQVPPGLGGQAFRLQGYAISPFASNGIFAATRALEITFP
jgi:hypothetical protein